MLRDLACTACDGLSDAVSTIGCSDVRDRPRPVTHTRVRVVRRWPNQAHLRQGSDRHDSDTQRGTSRGDRGRARCRPRHGRHVRRAQWRRIVAGASFEFTSGGSPTRAARTSSGTSSPGRSDLGVVFNLTPVTCPGEDPIDSSDDFDASIETSFFAEAPASSSTFGSKLSSAMAAGTVSGDISRHDPCTDSVTVVGQDAIDVSIALVATGPSVQSHGHSTGVDEEGNRVVQVVRYEDRPASGSVTLRWRRASGRRRDRQSVAGERPSRAEAIDDGPNGRSLQTGPCAAVR